ncbi:MAG: electron transfer flavoprotein subunit beta/FixA family protein [bacterium]|nr:electron transfer flavoprotein subunit beta/FixA family protein [bacterium]MDT8394872.1 electron transfer flavoprotein subunit beta/FixA family protein [bacterium]
MNIVVCIKQVPDTTKVKINPETNTLMREGVDSIINPFDMYAIEEAVRLREAHGGTVTALTMGPPQAESALREAISLGVDEACLVSDRAFAGSDTWATAYTLAAAVSRLGQVDLILCGKQAIDGDTAQVGPSLADQLGIPFVAFVRKIRSVDSGEMVVERTFEEGYELVSMPLPGLMTVVKEINEPRLPSLKGKMRAKKAEIRTFAREDLEVQDPCLGLDGSPTRVVKIFSPDLSRDGVKWTGEPAVMAADLVKGLKEQNII